MICHGCGSDENGYIDERTGRKFCPRCTEALVTWEADGCPDPDGDGALAEWIEAAVVVRVWACSSTSHRGEPCTLVTPHDVHESADGARWYTAA